MSEIDCGMAQVVPKPRQTSGIPTGISGRLTLQFTRVWKATLGKRIHAHTHTHKRIHTTHPCAHSHAHARSHTHTRTRMCRRGQIHTYTNTHPWPHRLARAWFVHGVHIDGVPRFGRPETLGFPDNFVADLCMYAFRSACMRCG